MIDGQEIQEPGLSGPGQDHKEKLCIGLEQLGQVFCEKLMRRKGIRAQMLPWKREGVDARVNPF